MPKQAVFLVRKLALRREETQVVQSRAAMGHRTADLDLNDGREGDGDHAIGTFLGSGMDVVRRDPDGDGDYAEASEFVSLSRLGRIKAGIAVSGMRKAHAFALGQWCGAREWTILTQLLAEVLNMGTDKG
jgi:hypothetical protein